MNGRIISMEGAAHREAQRLLPWFATGAVDDTERAFVEAHLVQCQACRVAIESERVLVDEARALPAGVEARVERGWDAMRRRLEREAARRPSAVRGLSRALLDWIAGDRWLRWAVAAQACVLLALGGAFVWREAHPPEYRVLGADAPANPGPGAGNVLVIFAPETTERDLRAVIRESGGRLVGGPTDADAYLLSVPAPQRQASLGKLRARPQVVLAEPIDPWDAP